MTIQRIQIQNYPFGGCNCVFGEAPFYKDWRVYCVKKVIYDNYCSHSRCLITQRCQKLRTPDEIASVQSFQSMMRRFYPTRVVIDGAVYQASVLNCPGCQAE